MPNPITGLSQQAYTTAAVVSGQSYSPPLIAMWITTGGTINVQGRGDAAASGTITVTAGLLTFPYPVSVVTVVSTAVLGVGVQAGS